ncbi:MAG: hypothetical protein HUJ60_01855, partial [Bacilli bacterium]|nr:hypothetical protein [Bacilli bacterium]
MKNKLTALSLLAAIALVSCGGGATSSVTSSEKPSEIASSSIESKTSETPSVPASSSSPSSEAPSSSPSSESPSSTETVDSSLIAAIAKYKADATDKLDEIVNPILAKISDAELRAALEQFYNEEKVYILAITDLDVAKAAAEKVIADASAFALNTLKPLGVQKLEAFLEPLIDKLPDADLKASVQAFYETEMAKINAASTLEDIVSLYKSILTDVEEFIASETERILILLKNQALEEIDGYVTALINKIPHASLKADTADFWNAEKTKIQNADTIDALNDLIPEIKEDVLEFAVSELIDISVAELDAFFGALVAKLPDGQIKTDIEA